MSDAIYCVPNNCEAPALHAEIERLQAHAQELETELRDSAYSEGELRAENERLQIGWDLATKAVDENERLRAENETLRTDEAKIRALVDEQAADEGLWFEAETCAEAYVQQALRRLHAVIEGKLLEQKASDPDEGLPTADDVRGILKPLLEQKEREEG